MSQQQGSKDPNPKNGMKNSQAGGSPLGEMKEFKVQNSGKSVLRRSKGRPKLGSISPIPPHIISSVFKEEKSDTKVEPILPWPLVDRPRVINPSASIIRLSLGKTIFRTRISTAINISSSGAGAVNSALAMSVVTTSPDFSAFSSIFAEYFVLGCRVIFQPVSKYNYPLTGAAATNVSSLPLGLCSLFHGQTAYSSLGSLMNSGTFLYTNTGDDFAYRWRNNEDPMAGTFEAYGSTTTQAWALTTGSAVYSGQIQFLSQSAPPGLPASQVIGTLAVQFDVLFRNRE
jgi:hypothetical protein